jgi:hypothetical protein
VDLPMLASPPETGRSVATLMVVEPACGVLALPVVVVPDPQAARMASNNVIPMIEARMRDKCFCITGLSSLWKTRNNSEITSHEGQWNKRYRSLQKTTSPLTKIYVISSAILTNIESYLPRCSSSNNTDTNPAVGMNEPNTRNILWITIRLAEDITLVEEIIRTIDWTVNTVLYINTGELKTAGE